MKRMLTAAATLLAAACAPAGPPATEPAPTVMVPAAAATVNPVGTFNFSTTVDGNPITGSIQVTGERDLYGGVIRTSITPDIPITDVTVEGQRMVVTANTPDGPLVLTMNFTGNAFTGGWTLDGDAGDITGQRAP